MANLWRGPVARDSGHWTPHVQLPERILCLGSLIKGGVLPVRAIPWDQGTGPGHAIRYTRRTRMGKRYSHSVMDGEAPEEAPELVHRLRGP